MSHLQDNRPPKNSFEKHLPCIILTDCSGGMAGAPIAELNQGFVEFGKALQADSLAQGRVDVCVMSFSDTVKTELGFRSAEDYQAPTLVAGGLVDFNHAVIAALNQLDERKMECKQMGVFLYKPWLFVLLSGNPTDDKLEADAKERLQYYISHKKINYFPMGIGNADLSLLQSYYPDNDVFKPVLKADQKNFKDIFEWLATNIAAVVGHARSFSGPVESTPVPQSITLLNSYINS